MGPRKQDLYLFFEENESGWEVINSQLVSLYMNRYIIDEEDQNEINGVYKLMKVPREQNWFDWLFGTKKESYDNQMIEIAYTDANSRKPKINTAHFIIGTMFLDGLREKLNYWFVKWLHNKFKKHFTQSNSTCNGPIVVTLLQGEEQFITGVELVKYFYFITDHSYFPPKRRRRTNGEGLRVPRSSVNDDLEAETNLFQNNNRLSDFHDVVQRSSLKWPRNIIFDHEKLFLWKMLTDSEETELRTSFNSVNWDPHPRYNFYECERFTMIAYPDKENCKIVDH